MIYYVEIVGRDKNTAAVKAPHDMSVLMEKRGYHKLEFRTPGEYRYERIRRTVDKIYKIQNWVKAFVSVSPNSVVVLQYPYGVSKLGLYGIKYMKKFRKTRFVLLLHDIDSIREFHREGSNTQEKAFGMGDCLICHNEKMKEYLMQNGIDEEKIFCMGIFDYLCESFRQDGSRRKNDRTVIIAGNLNAAKSPYIERLLSVKERDYGIHLYGPNLSAKITSEKDKYYGEFKPEELPEVLEGAFGLVWDGESLDTCSGATGHYLRYNNPHKLSLYIASQIPVIVWSGAALADYVRKNNLGIVVDSLSELNRKLEKMTDDEYVILFENVIEESKKLRTGYYLNHVLDQIEHFLVS